MAEKINTGNYRACRKQTGIANTIEILIKDNQKVVDEYWQTLKRDATYDYYREEEVVYRGTMKDEYGNDIDSSPCWIRI